MGWTDRPDTDGIEVFGFSTVVPAPGAAAYPDASMFLYGRPFGPAARTQNPGARNAQDAIGNCMSESVLVNRGAGVLRVGRSPIRMAFDDDFFDLPAGAGLALGKEHPDLAVLSTAAAQSWTIASELTTRPNIASLDAVGRRNISGHPGFDPEMSARLRPTPNFVVDFEIPIPFDGVISALRVWLDDIPATAGAYTIEVFGNDRFSEVDNALLAAPFDLTGVVANTVTSIGPLTTTTAHLTLKGSTGPDTELLTVRLTSDNADLTLGDALFLATYEPV